MRRIGRDNFVFLLGRNGEPISNQKIEIGVFHKDYSPTSPNQVSQSLTTDVEGKVGLGPLIDIERVTAKAILDGDRENHISHNETWYIKTQEKDQWT